MIKTVGTVDRPCQSCGQGESSKVVKYEDGRAGWLCQGCIREKYGKKVLKDEPMIFKNKLVKK